MVGEPTANPSSPRHVPKGLPMTSASFEDMVRRIRGGDEQAAVELVREFEPLIRREVRMRLLDSDLLRVFDSMDVCQSVWASFFLRAANGVFELDRPEQLAGLLVQMTRNKVAAAARHQYRQRRDIRRDNPGAAQALSALPGFDPTPSAQVGAKDLLERFRQMLGEEERRLAELRADGLPWPEIAERLGGSPQARRMQLARAVDFAANQLGIDAP